MAIAPLDQSKWTMANLSCDSSAPKYIIIVAATNGLSILICLLAAIFLCYLGLCTRVVYRLSLYQVLSSLAFALVCVTQVVSLHSFDDRVCTAIGWFVMYTQWMKLLFTMWLTVHLFCFGVLHKNLKRLEFLYVVTSLFVPAMVAAVPLVTNTYHVTPLAICWINEAPNASTAYVSNVETFALWYGPAMIVLVASSAAMVSLVITMARTVCRRSSYEPITVSDQYWNAFKQLVPLSAFPVLFCVFIMPPLILHVYVALKPTSCPLGLFLASSVCFSLWSMTSGITLIVHISVTKGRKYKRAVAVTPVTSLTCNKNASHGTQ